MSVRVEKLNGVCFLAFPNMQGMLTTELSNRFNFGKIISSSTISGTSFKKDNIQWYGDVLYCPDFNLVQNQEKINFPYWAKTTLISPFLLHFESIGEAAKALKEIQRNWAPYQYQFFRRSSLIQEKLPYINLKEKKFIKDGKFSLEIPKSPMGIYTLIDEKTILASAETSSYLPTGNITFVEDHENPPSRAYLKIQEALTLARHFFNVDLPTVGSKCFEAGACPGGWTWVLRQLGADVYAVDRAELAPELMKDSHVKFVAHDAFTLKPQEILTDFGKLDWVFSDVICYPERLYEWIQKWIESNCVKNMICTIKMQGETNWDVVQKFAEIPNSKVVHLNYNKHELTWIHCQ